MVEKSNKWGAEHLDDFLPGSKHLSLQERSFHVGRSSPRYPRKLPITKENTYLHRKKEKKKRRKKRRNELASRPEQSYSWNSSGTQSVFNRKRSRNDVSLAVRSVNSRIRKWPFFAGLTTRSPVGVIPEQILRWSLSRRNDYQLIVRDQSWLEEADYENMERTAVFLLIVAGLTTRGSF